MSEPLKEPVPLTDSQRLGLVKDLPHVRFEKFTSAYVNNTGVAANFYDLALVFRNVTVDASNDARIEDHAAITMSWEHAKAIAAGLRQAVENYEKEHNGKVRDVSK